MDDNATLLASPRSYLHARPDAIPKTHVPSPLVEEPGGALVTWRAFERQTHYPQAKLHVA